MVNNIFPVGSLVQTIQKEAVAFAISPGAVGGLSVLTLSNQEPLLYLGSAESHLRDGQILEVHQVIRINTGIIVGTISEIKIYEVADI